MIFFHSNALVFLRVRVDGMVSSENAVGSYLLTIRTRNHCVLESY